MHACALSTLETERKVTLSLRPAWLCGEILSEKERAEQSAWEIGALPKLPIKMLSYTKGYRK